MTASVETQTSNIVQLNGGEDREVAAALRRSEVRDALLAHASAESRRDSVIRKLSNGSKHVTVDDLKHCDSLLADAQMVLALLAERISILQLDPTFISAMACCNLRMPDPQRLHASTGPSDAIKIKTSQLSGKALDWAVTWIETCHMPDTAFGWDMDPGTPMPTADEVQAYSSDPNLACKVMDSRFITSGPATYGPASVIIGSWWAVIGFDPDAGEHLFREGGPTRFIAAMRCYVSAVLGDTVAVPAHVVVKEAIDADL